MGWPYGFLSLSAEELALRRQSLDFYACVAHYSAFAPALVFLLYRFLSHIASRFGSGSSTSGHGQYTVVPNSPTVKAQRLSRLGGFASRWRKLTWWLGDDIHFARSYWGQRDQWVLAAIWTTWLLVLCVNGTGQDYFHLTKRFGAIAVSQLPIHYLLALKALNPFAWAFKSSHEHINRYHRVLGRIIYGLLLIHLLLYNTYFIIAGVWLKRIFNPVVFCGVLASFGFHGIAGTAMRMAREFSYRLFFITHLVVALFAPVILFFHASSARVYIVETIAIFAVDLAVRRITTIQAPSSLELIPGTTLVKVTSSIPAHKVASFRVAPGLHIYLSIPSTSRTMAVPSSKSSVLDYLYNPFTVTAVNEAEGTVNFVTRTRNGPMTKVLSDFASTSTQSTSTLQKTTLALEGPYGTMASHFNHLLSWGASKILLVSGGVGASFTIPVYQALQSESPSYKLQLVWAIRSAGDATWAVSSTPTAKSILEDPNVHIFLTGDMGFTNDQNDAGDGGGVEMSRLHRENNRITTDHNRKRPNIERIVDDTFRQGSDDSVAIIVCGPIELTREVRQRVRPWVMRGRRVWWHGETFGW